MKIWTLVFALIYQYSLFAQDKRYVTIKAGESLMNVLSIKDIFHYPSFTQGEVLFKDGTKAKSKLNYNLLLDEMHFINQKGDTLSIANEKYIILISIKQDSFYYDQGYVRLLAGNNLLKLAIKQVWRVGDKKKIGAYNMPNSTASITSYSSNFSDGIYYDLIVNEDIDLTKAERYYFVNKYNRIFVANKKNLMILFPKQNNLIDKFLKENNIDFTNKTDLEKVVRYAGHL